MCIETTERGFKVSRGDYQRGKQWVKKASRGGMPGNRWSLQAGRTFLLLCVHSDLDSIPRPTPFKERENDNIPPGFLGRFAWRSLTEASWTLFPSFQSVPGSFLPQKTQKEQVPLCHHALPYLDDQKKRAWEDSQAALFWVALSESLYLRTLAVCKLEFSFSLPVCLKEGKSKDTVFWSATTHKHQP